MGRTASQRASLKKGRASDVVVGQILRYMGYVQEQLAEMLGYKRLAVSDWERNVFPVPRVVELALKGIDAKEAK